MNAYQLDPLVAADIVKQREVFPMASETVPPILPCKGEVAGFSLTKGEDRSPFDVSASSPSTTQLRCAVPLPLAGEEYVMNAYQPDALVAVDDVKRREVFLMSGVPVLQFLPRKGEVAGFSLTEGADRSPFDVSASSPSTTRLRRAVPLPLAGEE